MTLTKQQCMEYRLVLTDSYGILTKYQNQKKCALLFLLLFLMIPIFIYSISVNELAMALTVPLACIGIFIELYKSDFLGTKVPSHVFEETNNKTLEIIQDIKKAFISDFDNLEEKQKQELALLVDKKLANLQSEVTVAVILLRSLKE